MKIKTLVEFSGVPEGTTGSAEIDHDATWVKKDEIIYKVIWDLKRNKPLIDWFDQGEFDKFLEVLK